MGSILSSKKIKAGKIILRVEVGYEESLNLKGNIDDVYLFSDNASEIKTRFSQRGTNDATKYLLIPRCLRSGLNFNKEVLCQRIETPSRSIFVFSLEKSSN